MLLLISQYRYIVLNKFQKLLGLLIVVRAAITGTSDGLTNYIYTKISDFNLQSDLEHGTSAVK